MKIKNPILFWMFIVFAIVNLVDIITAKFILLGEANPIYLLTGNFSFIILLKVFVVIVLYLYIRRNIYPGNFTLFSIVMLLLIGTLLMSLGVTSNIVGMLNPDRLVEASKATTKEKVVNYSITSTVFYILPMILSFIGFIIYEKVRKKSKIDKKYFKEKVWWKRW